MHSLQNKCPDAHETGLIAEFKHKQQELNSLKDSDPNLCFTVPQSLSICFSP